MVDHCQMECATSCIAIRVGITPCFEGPRSLHVVLLFQYVQELASAPSNKEVSERKIRNEEAKKQDFTQSANLVIVDKQVENPPDLSGNEAENR